MWGTGMSDDKLVERITNFVKERVSPPKGFKKDGDNLVNLCDVVDDLKKQMEEEEK